MEKYPWWSEKQKKLAGYCKKFAEDNLPRGEEIAWTQEFPADLLKKMAEKGWFGALIPEKYGGIDLGVTGCCIIAEETARICTALTGAYIVTMFGGVEQLIKFGNEEQKKKWLPQFAKGKLGAICITEPGAGSDVASIETTATLKDNEYILNGKKRFITNAGVADIYCVYAKTGNKPEDKAKYKHLSAFIVEKKTSGFSIEKINELGGLPGLPNGYLDFDGTRVPAENRLGTEGDGWRIIVDGLNSERNLFAAAMLGPMREAIKYAASHAQRRIQFGQPTIEAEVIQFKIADMIARLQTARLLVYYAANLMDTNVDAVIAATLAKLYASESYRELMSDAIQTMGSDGWTRFYPVEGYMRDAKVNEIGTGTSEAMRMILYKQGIRALAEDFKMPPRRINEKLGIPTSTLKPWTTTEINEKTVLKMLAEDYRVNPGLYMSRADMKASLVGASDEQIDKLLTGLEAKGFVKLFKDRKGAISLAKATYEGLKKAKPHEYYKWFPEWIKKQKLF